jgi:4a-hydroxytetrahydrobiopterin dehydratase
MSLAQQHCQPARGPALAAADLPALLVAVPGWTVVDGALQRPFSFTDYAGTIAFVNAVAALAEREDHHPDLLVSWGRCTVRWHTHSVGGLSLNDFICAARVDALQP